MKKKEGNNLKKKKKEEMKNTRNFEYEMKNIAKKNNIIEK